MNKNKTWQHLFFTILAISPLIYMALIWPTVPARIPTHIGLNGPDNWHNKSRLWFPTGMVAGVTVLVYFLMQFINKIDPKRMSKPNAPVFNKLAIGLVIFMTAINYLTLLICAKGFDLKQAISPMIGLLFAFLGNIMHNLKPNYFAGIRTPWALNSDYNWRKTHQFAGKIWFGGGLLLALASLLLPMKVGTHLLLVIVILLALIPYLYSFLLFKKEQADPSIAKNDDADKN